MSDKRSTEQVIVEREVGFHENFPNETPKMSTELKSAQYLPAEYAEDLKTITQEAQPEQSVATESVSQPEFHRTAKRRDGVLSFITWTLAIFGGAGVVGGALALAGYAMSSQNRDEVIRMYERQPLAEQEILRRTFAAQEKYEAVIYFNMALRILVGVGFIFSCIFLYTYRANASSFAALCCVAAIFYNISTIVMTWLTMPSFEGIGDLPPEVGAFAGAIGIGVVAIFAFIKIGLYAFFAAYLSKQNIKAIFEPVEAVEPAPVAG